MAEATLFEVRTSRGNVYAIHDPSSGMVWTERTEQAARLLAAEKGLSVTQEKTISQEELLALTGREAPRPRNPVQSSPPAARPGVVNRPKESQSKASVASGEPHKMNLTGTAYHWEDEVEAACEDDPGIIIQTTPKAGIQDVFARGEIPVPPPAPADERKAP